MESGTDTFIISEESESSFIDSNIVNDVIKSQYKEIIIGRMKRYYMHSLERLKVPARACDFCAKIFDTMVLRQCFLRAPLLG